MMKPEILAECEAAREYYLDMDPEEAEDAFICEVAGFLVACGLRGYPFNATVSKVMKIMKVWSSAAGG